MALAVPTNLSLLEIALVLARAAELFVIMGDWNATPEQLLANKFPQQLGATLWYPAEHTCCSGWGRTLDFSLASSYLAKAVDTGIWLGARTAPHLPATATFSAVALDEKVLARSKI